MGSRRQKLPRENVDISLWRPPTFQKRLEYSIQRFAQANRAFQYPGCGFGPKACRAELLSGGKPSQAAPACQRLIVRQFVAQNDIGVIPALFHTTDARPHGIDEIQAGVSANELHFRHARM